MITHNNLIEITEKLSDTVKDKDVYIAIPNKNGYMLHEVVGAELVHVDGDIDGEYGVLVTSPVASYHLDGGAEQAPHDPDEVPVIRYEYIALEESSQEDLQKEISKDKSTNDNWPALPTEMEDIDD